LDVQGKYGLKVVQMLIDSKVYLDLQNKYGKTAIMFAAKYGREKSAQMLIDLKPNMINMDMQLSKD
jgi:ankyrin repeat protein